MCFFALILFVLYQICVSFEAKDVCSMKQDCDNKENTDLYTEISSKILSNVKTAFSSYKECSSQNCSCFRHIIDSDMLNFKNGITRVMIEKSRPKGVKYQIINKKLYREQDCMFPSRCSGVEHFLNTIRNDLPDIEFIVNVRDWPQVSKHFNNPLPVFSFSRTEDYYDIYYPTWSFWEGGPAINLYPRGIGRWDLFRETLRKEEQIWPWEKKKSKAFFRGSRTSGERDNLILLSRKKPKLVDAAYTKNQAWKSDKDTLGESPASEETLEHHCHYKYLFNFRGVAASFRLKFLFLCKSLVMHVGDEWFEFFYYNLKPWVHYVPVNSNSSISELEKLIRFFKKNDDLALQISSEGHKFIWENLTMENIVCYWKVLMKEYAKLLKFVPVHDRSLIDVTK